MLTRRIAATSACALALAVPAAAMAQPAYDGPVAYGGASVAAHHATPVNRSGVVPGDTKYDLQSQQDLKAPKPAPAPSPRAAIVSTDDGTNGWQIAALSEAGVLAALGLGSVALVRARRRVTA